MSAFDPGAGTRVRIDIPDENDPDHDTYHGRHGVVEGVMQDDASETTGDEQDDRLYRVTFDDGTTTDFRRRDLRPPLDQ